MRDSGFSPTSSRGQGGSGVGAEGGGRGAGAWLEIVNGGHFEGGAGVWDQSSKGILDREFAIPFPRVQARKMSVVHIRIYIHVYISTHTYIYV